MGANGRGGAGSGRSAHEEPSPLTQPPAEGVSPLQAAARHLWLIAGVAVIGAILGAGIGFAKKPMYSSETTLTVGRSTATANSVPGYAAALESLAGSYARMATSDRVRALALQKLRRQDLGAGIYATQIAQSSLFKIVAEGPDPKQTELAANVTGAALIRYLSTADTDPATLLDEYEKAQRELSAANAQVKTLQRSGTSGERVSAAYARQAAARLRAEAIQAQYPQARLNRGQVAAETLTPATPAVSDRTATVRLYGVLGFVLGGLIALLFATIRANRRTRP